VRDVGGEVPARVFDGLLFIAGLVGAQWLDQAKRIFAAAGSDLSSVVRALYFHSDISELRDPGFAFTRVEVVPGASIIVDLWGYTPKP
jgi:hypothetical protein